MKLFNKKSTPFKGKTKFIETLTGLIVITTTSVWARVIMFSQRGNFPNYDKDADTIYF
jgi:hypothetical protein